MLFAVAVSHCRHMCIEAPLAASASIKSGNMRTIMVLLGCCIHTNRLISVIIRAKHFLYWCRLVWKALKPNFGKWLRKQRILWRCSMVLILILLSQAAASHKRSAPFIVLLAAFSHSVSHSVLQQQQGPH